MQAAPGGATSNLPTALAKGDVALSITLTATASLLSVFTIPAIIGFSHNFYMGGQLSAFSVLNTVLSIFSIITVPVVAGLLLNILAKNFAEKREVKARPLSTMLFFVILVAGILQERTKILEYFSQVGLITLSLYVGMMILAFWAAKVFGSGERQRPAISIECGLQNGRLAMTLLVLFFGGVTTLIPAAIYSLLMFISALVLIFYVRYDRSECFEINS